MDARLDIRPISGPHAGREVLCRRPDAGARHALVLIHGRYGTAEGMIPLATALEVDHWMVVAPQAASGTWYPESFLAPIADNEPHLSSALELVDAAVTALISEGIEPRSIALLGFSQGACLALEYTARRKAPLGGVIGLSGGLIGPPGTRFEYDGMREGLRVFLGCSDVDPHIPAARVAETEQVFRGLQADVTARIYPGMGHTISSDELREGRALLRSLDAGDQSPS